MTWTGDKRTDIDKNGERRRVSSIIGRHERDISVFARLRRVAYPNKGRLGNCASGSHGAAAAGWRFCGSARAWHIISIARTFQLCFAIPST